MYDYLIVGAGPSGSVFANEAKKRNQKCLVIDRRNHLAGNLFTKKIENIHTHLYSIHVMHTNDKEIWDYINQFAEFNHYTHRPKATINGKIYSLPFNLNTLNEIWGVQTPQEAIKKLSEVRIKIENPKNLEEWAISQVGEEIYYLLIYGYTLKQWGREPRELPASILKRIPIRFTFDDNYFNDRYQGIPIGGYTQIFENMVDGCDVELNFDFEQIKKDWQKVAKKLVYTGPIDAFFDYEFGELEYRTMKFENKIVDGDFQGVSQMNYTAKDVPFTRIIEHKHFEFGTQEKSVITYEYPHTYKLGEEPMYPVNDDKNNELYKKYKDKLKDVICIGRLGMYQYFDTLPVMKHALNVARKELGP